MFVRAESFGADRSSSTNAQTLQCSTSSQSQNIINRPEIQRINVRNLGIKLLIKYLYHNYIFIYLAIHCLLDAKHIYIYILQ